MMEPGTLYGSSWWIAFGLYVIEVERRAYDMTLFIEGDQIRFLPDYTGYETYKEIIILCPEHSIGGRIIRGGSASYWQIAIRIETLV